MSYAHTPVMPEEVLAGLNIKPDGVYIDGTLGGAGHSFLIASRLTTGTLIGIDRDSAAVRFSRERMKCFGNRFSAFQGNFSEADTILRDNGFSHSDGILLDLGVSSHQLDTPERGFSYMHDARLDMRMDNRGHLSAYEVVNTYPEKKLIEILFSYGEERFAKRIVRAIIRRREECPIETTLALSGIITNAVPAKTRVTGGHPAKRTFQALRIEVNGELQALDGTLRHLVSLLKPGGRFCVITFHSLEDRIVKHCFNRMANPCECPRDLPICVCGKKSELRVITRKPVTPSEAELTNNHRAHSAKLRIAERTEGGQQAYE